MVPAPLSQRTSIVPVLTLNRARKDIHPSLCWLKYQSSVYGLKIVKSIPNSECTLVLSASDFFLHTQFDVVSTIETIFDVISS